MWHTVACDLARCCQLAVLQFIEAEKDLSSTFARRIFIHAIAGARFVRPHARTWPVQAYKCRRCAQMQLALEYRSNDNRRAKVCKSWTICSRSMSIHLLWFGCYLRLPLDQDCHEMWSKEMKKRKRLSDVTTNTAPTAPSAIPPLISNSTMTSSVSAPSIANNGNSNFTQMSINTSINTSNLLNLRTENENNTFYTTMTGSQSFNIIDSNSFIPSANSTNTSLNNENSNLVKSLYEPVKKANKFGFKWKIKVNANAHT